MSRFARTIWAVLLVLAFALPAAARFSGDETGGGGGITILPSAIAANEERVTSTHADYATSGITIRLPAFTTVYTAAIVVPGQDTPAAVFAGKGSSVLLPGPTLEAFRKAVVDAFTVFISTPQGNYVVDVALIGDKVQLAY